MDNGGQHENERHKMGLHRGVHTQWSMMPPNQMKETNALVMNKKIMQVIAEKNVAIEELNRAISNRNSALDERNEAIRLRDEAITARDTAYRERDSALSVLRFHGSSMKGTLGAIQRGTKRIHQCIGYPVDEAQTTDAFPLSLVKSENHVYAQQAKSNTKESKLRAKTVQTKEPVAKSPKKVKRVGEDLNRQVTTHGSKAEWDAQDLGLMEQINFDETTMPVPVCSCTGVPRQCYKGGKGGWQSSCCTTSLSVYPLPQLPNKRHGRIAGRKMSRSVFTRLLSRAAADGHNLSIPLDLKNYWAKHGTNRFITIK